MNAVSMIRNGYVKRTDGSFAKLLTFPNGKQSGNGINHYVELIIRSTAGKIIRVERMNKR
jgi:hypothetical protein